MIVDSPAATDFYFILSRFFFEGSFVAITSASTSSGSCTSKSNYSLIAIKLLAAGLVTLAFTDALALLVELDLSVEVLFDAVALVALF
jgi:hypothetical protein